MKFNSGAEVSLALRRYLPEIEMAYLTFHQDSRWLRQEMPGDSCWALLSTTEGPRFTCLPAEKAEIPPGAIGLFVVCSREDVYFLPASRLPAFFNAESIPVALIQRLWDKDRLTYHLPEGITLRLWYRSTTLKASDKPYDSLEAAICGYCRGQIHQDDSVASCPACGESIHADCLIHAGRRCPLCRHEMTSSEDTWFPPVFPCKDGEFDE